MTKELLEPEVLSVGPTYRMTEALMRIPTRTLEDSATLLKYQYQYLSTRYLVSFWELKRQHLTTILLEPEVLTVGPLYGMTEAHFRILQPYLN